MPPWYVVLRCWALGHRWVGDRRADPVIPLFAVCRWCGKQKRVLPPIGRDVDRVRECRADPDLAVDD